MSYVVWKGTDDPGGVFHRQVFLVIGEPKGKAKMLDATLQQHADLSLIDDADETCDLLAGHHSYDLAGRLALLRTPASCPPPRRA